MWVIESKQTDAVQNAALEEWLFRQVPQLGDMLLLYCNGPSVLIGRNQNPWSECPVPHCVEKGIRVIRRLSGGGAVYHDLGNLNFSLLVRKEHLDMEKVTAQLTGCLRNLGAEAAVDCHRSVTVRGRKVAGTASAFSGDSALFHGCMLVNADLERLREMLTPCAGWDICGGGTASMRMPVANLTDFIPHLTVEKLQDSIIESFNEICLKMEHWPLEEQGTLAAAAHAAYVAKYGGKAWTYERTADFELRLTLPSWTLRLRIQEGIVVSAWRQMDQGEIFVEEFAGKALRGVDKLLIPCYF